MLSSTSGVDAGLLGGLSVRNLKRRLATENRTPNNSLRGPLWCHGCALYVPGVADLVAPGEPSARSLSHSQRAFYRLPVKWIVSQQQDGVHFSATTRECDQYM
jgi:hypothetical protein